MLVKKNVNELCTAFLKKPQIQTAASRKSKGNKKNLNRGFSGGYNDC